jgi:hypothetical protein
MHPDGYGMVYDYEWPKTAADYAQLFGMKSFNIKEIYTKFNLVNGIYYTTGIKFMFRGEANPIT